MLVPQTQHGINPGREGSIAPELREQGGVNTLLLFLVRAGELPSTDGIKTSAFKDSAFDKLLFEEFSVDVVDVDILCLYDSSITFLNDYLVFKDLNNSSLKYLIFIDYFTKKMVFLS